ncbi:thermonuclease family protein [Paenibacillus larvae]|nr:thermonuclease family protein [Paenibacillus larvae]MDT2242943.1 thermonuclease family protein [Paenibacillus larvae]MDT2291772.1 thermonuclease family protein [Paenibacillus larvae]
MEQKKEICRIFSWRNFIAYIGGLLIGNHVMLVLACALGYWSFSLYRKYKGEADKTKRHYVPLGFAVFVLIIWGGMINAPEQPRQAAPVPTPSAPEPSPSPTVSVQPTPIPERLAAKVVNVSDVNSPVVQIDGKEEKVRLYLVETPEQKEGLSDTPLATEALDFARQKLLDQDVQIEFVNDQKDSQGRRLAFIHLGENLFNQMLLDQGLARMTDYPSDAKYIEDLKRTEETAKSSSHGIWGIANFVTESGYNYEILTAAKEPEPQAVKEQPAKKEQAKPETKPSGQTSPKKEASQSAPKPSPSTSEGSASCSNPTIKGNRNSMIYHVPGGAHYNKTKKNVVMFCSEKEAQAAGYRKSKN